MANPIGRVALQTNIKMCTLSFIVGVLVGLVALFMIMFFAPIYSEKEEFGDMKGYNKK